MAKGVAADGPVYPILISHKSYLGSLAIVWLIFVTMDFEKVKKNVIR